MKKLKLDTLLGLVLPWVCIVVFTIANISYVENLLCRTCLLVLIILNESVLLRLARNKLKSDKINTDE